MSSHVQVLRIICTKNSSIDASSYTSKISHFHTNGSIEYIYLMIIIDEIENCIKIHNTHDSWLF